MKTLLGTRLLVLMAFGLVGPILAAEADTIVGPAKRQEILDNAKNLLAAKTAPVASKNPFQSEVVEAAPEPQAPTGEPAPVRPAPAGPRSTHDLLQAIASSPSLKPSGSFVISNQPVLLFGQKRVKAGGILNITFEGTEYALEIVSITPPNFTLRLNREEFTRPIK